jgi:peptide deformylase
MLKILTLENDILRKHSAMIAEFNGDLRTLIEQMFEAMYREKGIGLAAVQVGRLQRLFITHVQGDKPRVFINPDILETSLEQGDFEEGCLSIPGINSEVLRSVEVRVQAWNEKGRPFSVDADKFLARVIQHEMDHLNGILFIDRLDARKKERLLKVYEQQKKAS